MRAQQVPVIAIDGPGGAGKGSVAQIVAQRLGFYLLDSGALYRILAYRTEASGTAPEDAEAVAALVAGLQVEFRPSARDEPAKVPPAGPGKVPPAGSGKVPPAEPAKVPLAGPGKVPPAGPGEVPLSGPGKVPPAEPGKVPPAGSGKVLLAEPAEVLLAGKDISGAIRLEKIGELASRIAAHPEVREALGDLQRAFRKAPGLVADGRDMGTLIFPDAAVKIFLTATPEERARRRQRQLRARGENPDLQRLQRDIEERDRRDSQRSVAPLHPAADALILDSTGMSVAQVVAKILGRVARSGALPKGKEKGKEKEEEKGKREKKEEGKVKKKAKERGQKT